MNGCVDRNTIGRITVVMVCYSFDWFSNCIVYFSSSTK